ncbi:hypothetical protein RJ639_021208 [Escallonia herrerae]|uniref:DDE Tnp4 domain-containing protein n=1 Tax=Escallonia herrerae TaxID=1293975 RepID=A0AA89AHD6_9ASTE|nr:hypothetical protein RJ639_021208 [Escallonia herrerae]
MPSAGGVAKHPTTKRKPKKLHHHQNLTHLLTLASSAASSAHSFLLRHDLLLLPRQSLSLHSHLSSLSHLLSRLQPHSLSKPLPPPQPPPCWFHRFLSSATANYDTRWTHSFRMSKPSFILLLRLLTPSLLPLSPTTPIYALAATLFRLAHAAPFQSLSPLFGLDPPTACRSFYTVCKAIIDKLGHLFEFRSDLNRIVVGFGWISLPNCCGVLGYDAFKVDGDLLGENGSLLVQALVDSEGRFLDVSAGWPDTVKPDSILRQSELFSGVEELRELLNGPCFQLSDGNAIPQYVLGGSCLPLLPWLLTPFGGSNESRSTVRSSEAAYNSVHGRGMELAGKAFGRVRVEWQLLSRPWKEECIESFPFVVVTCCLLHNFLIKCSEALPDVNLGLSSNHDLPLFEGEVDDSAHGIRNALALHLSRFTVGGSGSLAQQLLSTGFSQRSGFLFAYFIRSLNMVCLSLLNERSMLPMPFKLENVVGIIPLRQLWDNLGDLASTIFPITSAMRPVNLSQDKSITEKTSKIFPRAGSSDVTEARGDAARKAIVLEINQA